MGRASFRSMRSLTSARSLGESIFSEASNTSLEVKKEEPVKSEIPEVSKPEMVRPASPVTEQPAKSISPPESPVVEKAAETITVVSGGKRASFTVKNVVDC